MDLQTLTVILGLGSVLGSVVLNFYANRKTKTAEVNRAVIEDQEKRIKQLEEERERNQKTIADQEARIKSLETEKLLPLEKLTELINKNTQAQNDILESIVKLLKDKK